MLVTIPSFTINSGVTVLPSVDVGTWTSAKLFFDLASLPTTLTLTLKGSFDGSTFIFIGSIIYAVATSNAHMEFVPGTSWPNLKKIQLSVTTNTTFTSNGGTLTVT